MKPSIAKKHQPRGYEILHEDRDLLVGNKAPGFTTVRAKWNQGDSVQDALDVYIRKGNVRSRNAVYVVHRLDQATSGVLIFAKSESAQLFLKQNWPNTEKQYYAVVHGQLTKKSGTITSYLVEDEETYVVKSNADGRGKLSHTRYEVVKETDRYSLLLITLLTGRKNQIRVHLSDAGHPVVGDTKYGGASKSARDYPTRGPAAGPKSLALHAKSISFDHPHSRERLTVSAPVPAHFRKLVAFDY